MNPSHPAEPDPSPPPRSPLAFWLGLAFAVLVLGAASFLLKSSLSRFDVSRHPPLPVLHEIRAPFSATDRYGDSKNLADLRGKAVVLAYTYTRCPHGCAGVAAQMIKVRDAFAGNPDVHLVSIAVWPDVDSPPVLKAFSESLGVPASDPWWWLSADKTATWDHLTREIGFHPCREVPPDQRLNSEDYVEHDLRAVLIDPRQRVRAFYSLMHPQTEAAQMALEKLMRDIRAVLAE
jgi:cytochrome oxidase Cu insertion factor (SCO1/SenC/PrrC family)